VRRRRGKPDSELAQSPASDSRESAFLARNYLTVRQIDGWISLPVRSAQPERAGLHPATMTGYGDAELELIADFLRRITTAGHAAAEELARDAAST
jgi:hypothetical protein